LIGAKYKEMLTKEYRIPLPLSLDEYKRGLLYMISKTSTIESSSGVPMEIVTCKPFENELGKGIYTHRILYLDSRLPEWGKKLILKSGTVATALQVHEKSWNAFPYIKTLYTSPLFSEDKFEIVVESRHDDRPGTTDNIHHLPPSMLKKRIVDVIDIAQEKVEGKYYKKEEDPSLFKSKKTRRGPLKSGWQNSTKPIMCAYKLVTVNFAYWGLRTKMEKMVHDVIRGVYLHTHRQTVCWMDDWYELSYEQVRKMEDKLKDTLNQMAKKELETMQKKQNSEQSSHSRWSLKSKL